MWYIDNMREDETKTEQEIPEELPPENPQPWSPFSPYPPPEKTEWRIWEVAMVFFMAFLLSSLPAMFVNSASSVIGLSLISYLLQIACFFLLPLINVWVLHGQTPAALGLIPPRLVACIKIALPSGVIFYLLNVLTSALVSLIMPSDLAQEQSIMVLFESAANNLETVLLILFVAFLAPVSEEMLFRAFLLPPLMRRYGRRIAFVTAAAIFAGMHFNLWVFPPLFVGGLCFCWLYDKYGNLFYNIVAHCTWNILALIAYFTLGA